MADNAYSYAVTLEKLPAGTDDGSGTRFDLVVFQADGARTLTSPSSDPKFRLNIPADQLDGAGRCAGLGGTVWLQCCTAKG